MSSSLSIQPIALSAVPPVVRTSLLTASSPPVSTAFNSASSIVDISDAGFLLSSVAAARERLQAEQAAPADSSLASVLATAQSLVDTFNSLQCYVGSLQTLLTGFADNSLVDPFAASLNQLASNNLSTDSASLVSLQGIGIQLLAATAPGTAGTLVNRSTRASSMPPSPTIRHLNNTFRDNGAGVAVMYSKKVKMENNHFDQNWGPSAYGILLKDISDSYISHNTFYKNTVGIHMEGSSRMTIERNIFKENGWAIKVQASCENNTFQRNNFTGNSFDVGTNGSLSLNEFSSNYWDKYEGYDINRDGVGDVPYHPVSMYSMIIEQNPNALMLLRSFTVQLLDKAEKAIPSLTPENLVDKKPMMKSLKL